MGTLSNMNGITEPQIPSEIARDTEVTSAIASHAAATDPHPIYLTQTEGDGRYRQSAVALADADIPAAIARDTEVTSAIAAHASAIDPHPIYLRQTEGDNRYRQGAVALADADIPAAIARDTEVTSAIAAHASAINPHPIYLTQIEGDNRYRQSAVALADADIPAAIARDAEVTNAIATHVSATRLEDSTPIKIKLIQGTTAAAQGQSAIIPHGLDFNKILSAQVVVRSSPSLVPVAFQNGSGTSGGFRFNWAIVQGDLYIHNVQGESVGLLSRPVLALITYLA